MAENSFPDINIDIPDKVLQVINGSSGLTSIGDNKLMSKVPSLLRLEKNNQQEYDPVVISIGPYHHGKKELQLAEDFKIAAFKALVGHSGKDAKLFYDKVLDVVINARNCYIDDSTDQYPDAIFAQMMLLDACILILFIIMGSDPPKYILELDLPNFFGGIGYLSTTYILRDLCLLENQIPFWLIRKLIVVGYGEQKGNQMLREMCNNGKDDPIHFLHWIWFGYSSSDQIIAPPKLDNNNSIHSFRSASELKERGIHFCPSTKKGSLTSFKLNPGKLFSTLEVPVCDVGMFSKSLFLNMMAYEISASTILDNRNVTGYITFMKELIENTEDVKELREKKILLTTLGSDEDVLKFFKELNTYRLDLYEVEIFSKVKDDIQAHYNNNVKKWIGQLVYTYFRSPWTAIALLAAVFLLVLTFLQTYYTINPWSG